MVQTRSLATAPEHLHSQRPMRTAKRDSLDLGDVVLLSHPIQCIDRKEAWRAAHCRQTWMRFCATSRIGSVRSRSQLTMQAYFELRPNRNGPIDIHFASEFQGQAADWTRIGQHWLLAFRKRRLPNVRPDAHL